MVLTDPGCQMMFPPQARGGWHMPAACLLIRTFLSNMYALCVCDVSTRPVCQHGHGLEPLEADVSAPCSGPSGPVLSVGDSLSRFHPFVSAGRSLCPHSVLLSVPHPPPPPPAWGPVRAVPGGSVEPGSSCGGSDCLHCRRSVQGRQPVARAAGILGLPGLMWAL